MAKIGFLREEKLFLRLMRIVCNSNFSMCTSIRLSGLAAGWPLPMCEAPSGPGALDEGLSEAMWPES